ncbi:hypothetical protein D3C71_1770810 [compost metagenome]
MPWLAGIGEQAFQRAEQVHVADRLAQFLGDFPGDGIAAQFTELDAATQRPAQGLAGGRVVEDVDQDLALVMEHAQCEKTDTGCWWRRGTQRARSFEVIRGAHLSRIAACLHAVALEVHR